MGKNQVENQTEKKEDIVYFVSFYHARGFDNVEVTLFEEIHHIDQIKDIEHMIEEELEYKSVKVQKFDPLRLVPAE